ncbi:hypothetical protein ALQ26_05986 [Pseudomonas amygdali pv. lachrymans]|nr:hypothetical protein ALQ26_05986 [Pseudomonas amygdali pv. lachrymans]
MLQAQRRVLQISLAGTRGQQLDILDLVTLIKLLAGRPVVGDFVVIPLPDLRHFCVEAAQIFIHQVIAVIASVLVEGLRHLAFRLGGQVAPDPPAFRGDLLGHWPVGVNGVTAVDKKVRQAQAHRLIDTHATNVRVDTEALPHRVATPDEADVTTLLGRAAQMAEPGLAGDTALSILERDAVENRLIDRQPAQLDPRSEVGTRIGERRDHAPWLGKHTACVPFDHHPRRPVAAAPDHDLVAEYISGLHTIDHFRTVLHRSDHRRRKPRQQQTGPHGLDDTATLEIELAHGYPLADRQKSTVTGECWRCMTTQGRNNAPDAKNRQRPLAVKLPRLIPARGA